MKLSTRTLMLAAGIAGSTLGLAGIAVAEDGNRDAQAPVVQNLQADGADVNIQDAAEDGSEDGAERTGRRGRSISTVADTIGVEVEDLRASLQGGQTIAEVAEANDVDPQEVIDALVESKSERLDAKVEAGDITQEEADEKLAEKTERIENKVNGLDNDDNDDNDDNEEADA